MKIRWGIWKKLCTHCLWSLQRFPGCGRGREGIQSSLIIYSIQNWRNRSNRKTFRKCLSTFPLTEQELPVTCLTFKEKGVFCRSTSQVKFTLGKGLWRCPSSWPNQDFRVCEDRAFCLMNQFLATLAMTKFLLFLFNRCEKHIWFKVLGKTMIKTPYVFQNS